MKSVLVVDDDPRVRRTLSASLEFAGYEVTAVGSGTDALTEIGRLLERVRAHLDEQGSPSDDDDAVVTHGTLRIDLRHRLVTRRGRRVPLSAREFELLRYLLEHRNEIVSREQLLRDVWGYNQLAISRTVDNYVAKLRTHIEERPHRPRLIVTVHGSGYQLVM